MDTLILKRDEIILIQKLRSAPKYSTLTVEKRPTKENPDGEVNRILIESSYLVSELALKP